MTLPQRSFSIDITTKQVNAADAEVRGDLPGALAAFGAMRGDLTSDLGAQFGQGRVPVRMGRTNEALPVLERHLQRDPWSAEGPLPKSQRPFVLHRVDESGGTAVANIMDEHLVPDGSGQRHANGARNRGRETMTSRPRPPTRPRPHAMTRKVIRAAQVERRAGRRRRC